MQVPAAGIASDAFAATRRSLVGTGKAAASIERADAASFDAAPPPSSCAMVPEPAAASLEPLPAGIVAEDEPPDDTSGETTHVSWMALGTRLP
jgi:hypothetical protein